MDLHARILECIEHEHGDLLAAAPQLNQDALDIRLRNGVMLTVRYAAADAYSLRWRTSVATKSKASAVRAIPTITRKARASTLTEG